MGIAFHSGMVEHVPDFAYSGAEAGGRIPDEGRCSSTAAC